MQHLATQPLSVHRVMFDHGLLSLDQVLLGLQPAAAQITDLILRSYQLAESDLQSLARGLPVLKDFGLAPSPMLVFSLSRSF